MNMQIGCELFIVKQATRFFWRFIFFISVNLYTYGSAEILITKMQKMVKLHRVRVHFEQGVTTPSS